MVFRIRSIFIRLKINSSVLPPNDSPFIKKGWNLVSTWYPLPKWFTENRIHQHTSLIVHSLTYGKDTPAFLNASKEIANINGRILTRSFKFCNHEYIWHSPTLDGNTITSRKIHNCDRTQFINISANRDLAKEMIDDAHQNGIRLIAYIYISTDFNAETKITNSVCKDVNGVILSQGVKGNFIDITIPKYRKNVLIRLKEAAAKGIDGFYFDEEHLPGLGCWGTLIQDSYQKKTGKIAPTSKNINDPNYRNYLEFQAYKIEETFHYWREEVKKDYPNVVFIVSTSFLSSLNPTRSMSTNLCRIIDSPKTEFGQATALVHNYPLDQSPTVFDKYNIVQPEDDIRKAFGWTLLKSSADGRLPHVWEAGRIVNSNHAIALTAAVLTYGCISNLHIPQELLANKIIPPHRTSKTSIIDVINLSNKVSPFLSNLDRIKWAAVHYSELSSHRKTRTLEENWRLVLSTVHGVFGVFTRLKTPIDIINDFQLEQGLQGYKILYLPMPMELTLKQRNSVNNFVANGGILLTNQMNWDWSNPSTFSMTELEFSKIVKRLVTCSNPKVEIRSARQKFHVVSYQNSSNSRLVVAMVNDFSFVQKHPRNGSLVPNINSVPPSVNDVEVLINNTASPSSIKEIVTGINLNYQIVSGKCRIAIPAFSIMAFVVVEY